MWFLSNLDPFYIFFKANNQPQENSILVRYENLDTLLFKNNFISGGTTRDTLQLFNGSYAIDVYDYDRQWEGGDGISWWLNSQQGWENAGQVNLRKVSNNQIIKNYNGDFGSNIHYEFTVGYPLGYNEPRQAPAAPVHPSSLTTTVGEQLNLNVFPNPANNNIIINLSSSNQLQGKLVIINTKGQRVYEYELTNSLQNQLEINTASLAAGVYAIHFSNASSSITKNITIQH